MKWEENQQNQHDTLPSTVLKDSPHPIDFHLFPISSRLHCLGFCEKKKHKNRWNDDECNRKNLKEWNEIIENEFSLWVMISELLTSLFFFCRLPSLTKNSDRMWKMRNRFYFCWNLTATWRSSCQCWMVEWKVWICDDIVSRSFVSSNKNLIIIQSRALLQTPI